MNLLELPFDMYQRMKIAAEIVSIIRQNSGLGGSKSLKILDVGGYPGTILEFLPADEVKILDVKPLELEGYVQGDGCDIPFDKAYFDVVISLDTLEHVPRDRRRKFVEELVRATNDFIVLIAPFRQESVELAEKVMYQYILFALEAEHEQLREHIENGLPELEEFLSRLKDAGLAYVSFPSGYLPNWLLMMAIKYYISRFDRDGELERMVDCFYNTYFYQKDQREPGYRRVVVASKKGSLDILKEIELLFEKYATLEHDNGTDPVVLSLLQNLGSIFQGMKFEKILADKEGHIQNLEDLNKINLQHIENFREIVDKQTAIIKDFQEAILQKDNLVREKEREVHNLKQEIEKINTSVGERDERISQLMANISDLERTISDLERELDEARRTLTKISSSRAYQIYKFFKR